MGELVRFRDVATEAFREMDPEAGYVFVAAKDSAGYPTVYHKILFFIFKKSKPNQFCTLFL